MKIASPGESCSASFALKSGDKSPYHGATLRVALSGFSGSWFHQEQGKLSAKSSCYWHERLRYTIADKPLPGKKSGLNVRIIEARQLKAMLEILAKWLPPLYCNIFRSSP